MHFPLVSVCTPTRGRRRFIPQAIRNIANQSYPAERIEWVVVDASSDSDAVEDLVTGFACSVLGPVRIKYIRVPESTTLGAMRNKTHEHAEGDFLVYMDDDDYYPPQRIGHAVGMLGKAMRKAGWAPSHSDEDTAKRLTIPLLAGCSLLRVWFSQLHAVWQFGPHGRYHSTAATLAMHRSFLLRGYRYDESSTRAEESSFLKSFTVPLIQLDTNKTILAISHGSNTVDRIMILVNARKLGPDKSRVVKLEHASLESIVRDAPSLAFLKAL